MHSHEDGRSSPREEACPESCAHFRIGLPILPVRYAVLDTDSKLPGLSAAFQDASLVGLGNPARYGLRLLRRGYVYVYNENYRELEGYLVTRKGTLLRLRLGSPTPPDHEAGFNCQWQEHWGPAACLTVPDAQVATKKIWICFSDVEWTGQTCEAHADSGESGAALRRRHMVPFDVKAWLATQRHAHAAPIETIDAHVAEFATGGMAPSAINRAFEWSVTPPLERAGVLSSLVRAGAERLAQGKGLVLALPDPVGIVQDLNALIKYRLARFMSQDEREWKLSTSVTIQALREACARQALDRRRIERVERLTINARPRTSAEVDALMRAVEEAEDLSDSEVEATRQEAWKRYLDDYDEQARADFDAQFQRDLDELEHSALKPLASALAVWLRHESMCAAFQCNFDARNLHSGHSYVGVAWSMIHGVTGYDAVAEELVRQMEAEFIDKDAIFKRALLLNCDAAANEIAKVATGALNLNDEMFWKRATDLFKDVYTGQLRPDVLAAIRGDLAKLLHELAPAVVRVLGGAEVARGPRWLQMMATLGWISGREFRELKYTGTKGEMEKFLKEQILKRAPGANPKLLKPAIHKVVDQELKRNSAVTESASGKMAKRESSSWFFFLDEDLARTLGDATDKTQMLEKLRASTLNTQQLEQLVHAQYRRYVFNPAHALAAKAEPALGVVALILESVALYRMPSVSDSSNERERALSASSITAAKLGLLGSSVELVGEMSKRTKWGAMRLSAHVPETNPFLGTRGLAIATFGRLIGTVGGLIAVYVDIKKAVGALREKKAGLGAYLLASAFAGFICSVGYFLGLISGGLAFIVMLALAVAGLVMSEIVAMFSRNGVEVWLSRAKFGLAGADKYQGLDDQRTAMSALTREN